MTKSLSVTGYRQWKLILRCLNAREQSVHTRLRWLQESMTMRPYPWKLNWWSPDIPDVCLKYLGTLCQCVWDCPELHKSWQMLVQTLLGLWFQLLWTSSWVLLIYLSFVVFLHYDSCFASVSCPRVSGRHLCVSCFILTVFVELPSVSSLLICPQLFPHVVPLPDHLLSVYIVRVSPWPLLHCEISYVNISKVFLVIRVLCLCISSSQCRCFSVCKCALINGTPSVSLSLCPVVGVWFLTQNTWSVSGYRDSWSTGGANTVCWASTQRALLHQYVLIFGLLGAGRINHWRQKEKWSHVMLDKLTWTVRGKAEGLKKYGDCDWTAVQNSIVGLYLNVFAQGDCLKRWKCR